jgi:hypothetical protein
MTYIDHDYELEEQHLREQYLGCLYAKAMPSQLAEHSSYLVLVDNKDLSGPDSNTRWTIMGDLTPAWGIDEIFSYIEGNKSLFGHYIVRRDLMLEFPHSEFADTVELDPEGGTFFAYAKDEETGRRFIDWIDSFIRETEGYRSEVAS